MSSSGGAVAMDADAPWSSDVSTFVSPDRHVPDAARVEARTRLAALLGSGRLTFLALLRGMEACLVTTDDAVRARGVLLLAELVARPAHPSSPPPALPASAAPLLAQFFVSKLDDFAAIRAALAGCAALLTADAVDDRGVRAPAVDRAGAVEMADRFFDAVHVPSLVQADRAKAYELLAALVSRADDRDRDENASSGARGPPLGSAPPAEQLELIVAACDGEKDPRNVLLVCELWALLPRAFCGAAAASEGSEGSGFAPSAAAAPSPAHAAAFASAAEELYDVVAAYFPVSFRPPANDRVLVTHEQLAATLRSAMCASPSYAPWAVPHVLESLDETKPPKTLDDALATVCACGASFGREAMRPHLRAVWGALRNVLLRPPAGPELTAEGAARWATRCFAAEWSRSDVNDVFQGSEEKTNGDAAATATANLSLVSLALEDACLSDAASALSGAAAGRGAAASGAGGCCGGRAHEGGASGGEGGGEGGGCCGGGGGGEGLGSAAAEAPVSPKTPVSSRETTRRGHALVAGAGRVLGAVAAASPAAARASIARGLAPLLDAAGVGPSGELDAVAPGVAPLALVLAMPAVCGALDGASVRSRGDVNDAPKESSPSSSSSSSSSVLGATGRRLAGLFAAAARRGVAGAGALRGDPSDDEKEAAADEIPSSIAEEDGVTLGVAGLKALLAFPAGEFLRGEGEEGGTSTVDVAVGALTDAAVDVEAEEAVDDSDADAQAVFAARAAARITSRRRAAEALARAAAMPAAHPAAVSVARRATPALVSAFDAGRRRGASDSAARRRGVAALDAAAAAANAAPACRAAAVPALCAAAAATLAGKGGDEGGVGDEATWSALADALAGAEASEGSEAAASSSASSGPSFEGSFGGAFWSPAPKTIPGIPGMLAASVSPADPSSSSAESAESAAARSLARAALEGFGARAADSRAARVARSAVAACDETTRLELATRAVATLARGDAANAEAFNAAAAVATGACERTLLAAFETLDGGGGLDVFATLAGMATRDGDEARAAAAADALATSLNKIGDKIAVGGAPERRGDASAALERAFAGGLCSHASLRHAAGAGAAAKALRALFARGDAAADALASRLREALGADAADGDANDAGSVSFDSPDEATKTRVTNSVSSGAARAFGLAMAPGGGGLGVARAARARVKPLATQRFFARTLPALLAPLGSSSSASAPLLGRANRAAYLRAFLHLARHAPRAALVQTVATTLPVLAEAIESAAGFDRSGDEGESAADPDALASGLALASAFLSDDRAREALAAHAERHAGALVSALCRVSVSVSRERGLAMAAREDALDALAAAAERGSLPFAAVYPRRREATEAATRALDDPKRRVRRMAARCKEAWRELGEAQ